MDPRTNLHLILHPSSFLLLPGRSASAIRSSPTCVWQSFCLLIRPWEPAAQERSSFIIKESDTGTFSIHAVAGRPSRFCPPR